eukprot:CAMPEP_0172519292 /NCGR_PEP_ID=MMETSP1066-20121228/291335_1 /TAXON_ID=671091 /ORGANISM="Coscinodiscus wailesii, Strain CCMP2513" /LENGTH=36 /DNA_ID= /DNA_START= /DNA_END= /DNA_ORIENTATION=
MMSDSGSTEAVMGAHLGLAACFAFGIGGVLGAMKGL